MQAAGILSRWLGSGVKPSDQHFGPVLVSLFPNAPIAHIYLAPVFFQRFSGDLIIAPTLQSNCRNGGGTQTVPSNVLCLQ